MNIVFISALEGGKYSGPLHSVPKQVKAQSKVDNVYWVNLTNIETGCEIDKEIYHYIPYKIFSISKLPSPFCHPDIVVFEEFFKVECCIVAKQIVKMNIPYVIVPRCQMTEKYLHNKWIKKKIACFLMFSHFAKRASAVQFLSKQEKEDSRYFYNRGNSVISNGIDIFDNRSFGMNHEVKICTFIGRYSVWQKGLDLLIDSISNVQNDLRNSKMIFKLYGPDERTGSKEEIKKLVRSRNIQDLVHVNGPVFDDEKNRVLLDSALFVHTSRFEGMPMSVLEALSYGLPCIVTQGSNLREDIDMYDAGWGCDTSVDAITEVLKCVLEELDLLGKKNNNALKMAHKYSWPSIALESHEFYCSIVNGRGIL